MKAELDLDLKGKGQQLSHLPSKLAKSALKVRSSFYLSAWIRLFGFQCNHQLPPAETGRKSSDDTTMSFTFKYWEEGI